MNRYSWVCFGESTPPHPARLRNGARSGKRGGQGAGKRRGGRGRGAPGQGGRCVRASHATTATILSGRAGLLHPSCKKRNRAGLRRFPNQSPPQQGLDPATGLTPTPWEQDAGAAPQGHPPPRREQSQRGAARNASLGPQRGGWPPWQAPWRAACDALSPPTKVNKLCSRRQRSPRAQRRGRPGAGGSSRAPSGTAPLSGHGRDAPRRPPLSRTHHGIFFHLHFFHISPQISRCNPPPPSAAPPASAAICLISLP